jgi:hypothetical protein
MESRQEQGHLIETGVCELSKGLFSLLDGEVKEVIKEEKIAENKHVSFEVGSIHKSQFRQFWLEELKYNDWVKQLLKIGYVLPFREAPPLYEEDNNASAQAQMDYVREAVRQWEQQGVVRITKEKPFCVSPLSVVERVLCKGETKLRLCWDGSRCVNQQLEKKKVKLDHLQVALECTKTGDLQAKYDLK